MKENLPTLSAQLFPLGQLVITATALDALDRPSVNHALQRHAAGDWGELCQQDVEENARSLQQGGRLFSAYTDQSGVRFWIITEADRSVTTVLRPEDY